MNIPMNDELKNQLIADTNGMKAEALDNNEKLKSIITASRNKTVIIAGPGFDLRVRAAIPGPIKDKLVITQNRLQEVSEYMEARELIISAESEFVASVCADEELSSADVWREYERQTGLLDELTKCILSETTGTENQVKHFRKMP